VEIRYRAFDIVAASALLILFMPLMLVIAVVIRFESRGRAIFRQRRLGRSQSQFTVHKFRTMQQGASQDVHREFVLGLIAGQAPPETEEGPRFKLAGDDRITRAGRILRRYSLDELPQLWDVLRGDMSLVGPRPALPYEAERYPAHWFGRFAVKPGITGLWQVSGRSELTMEEMIRLDLEYVERRSLRLNIWVVLRTLPAVVSARGAG